MNLDETQRGTIADAERDRQDTEDSHGPRGMYDSNPHFRLVRRGDGDLFSRMTSRQAAQEFGDEWE